MEVLWEQWLQICSVRVVPWVLYLLRAGLGRPIYDKDARLVPYAAKELASWEQADLCDVLAREYLILS